MSYSFNQFIFFPFDNRMFADEIVNLASHKMKSKSYISAIQSKNTVCVNINIILVNIQFQVNPLPW